MKTLFGIIIFTFVLFPYKNTSLDNHLIDGKELYKEGSCKSCHGRKGKSILVAAGDLTNPKLTLEQRIEMITNGSKNNPSMVAFKERFTTEEIRAIAEYTMTFIKE